MMTDPFAPLVPVASTDYTDAVKAQSEAADPAHSAWVVANAGSGKTKVLIDRVARLLLRRADGRVGAKPDSILCITYTKAAANEMLSRLFGTLGNWSMMEDQDLRAKLAELEGRDPASYERDDLKAARALFARALETPGGLRIETIHAFCARVLRRFPLEAGVYPGFTDIEEREAAELWDEARREAILAAAEKHARDLDILARASGHDGAMAALNALRNNSAAARQFATSHKGDMGAMEDALREAMNAPLEGPEALIGRAMGEEFPEADIRAALTTLRTYNQRDDKRTANAIEAALAASDAGDKWTAYRRAFFGAKMKPYTALYNAGSKKDASVVALFGTGDSEGTEVARMLEFVAKFKAAETLERTLALLRIGLPALEAYGQAKQMRAALDFDDLIEKTRALLSTREASEWVLYKLDGGLSHVLVDEAQDTSPAQWQLINALVHEFFAGKGSERQQDPRTQFVVGDEKQSIFSFQGADPDMFHSERQAFQKREPSNMLPEMQMSFRSSPEVLGFVDTVWNLEGEDGAPHAADVPVGHTKTHHTARRAGQPGRVELWPIVEHERADTDPDGWARPLNALVETSPKARLAAKIAAMIQQMIKAGETVWEEISDDPERRWQRRASQPEDFLILVRNRKDGLFEALIAALKRHDLPVAGADRLVLADHIGVQDCLNLMRFALLPGDDLTLAEILRGPFCGLVDDDTQLFIIAHDRGRGVSLWDSLQGNDAPQFDQAKAFLENVLGRAGWPPYEFLSAVLDQEQPLGKTGWQLLNARLGSPARDPIEALLARAIGHDAAMPASLQAFIAVMESDKSDIKRDLAAPDGEIRVMTVHGAKGLQSPVVILPDTTSAPKARSGPVFEIEDCMVWSPRKDDDTGAAAAQREIDEAKALREHKRLLYVALTRAQDRLVICGAWNGRQTGKGYVARSWYDLCATAMEAYDPIAEDEEMRPRTHGDPAPCLPAHEVGAAEMATLPEWALRRPPVFAGMQTRQIAPSALLRANIQVPAPFGAARAQRMRRGQLIHALLQYLPDIAASERRAAGANWLARQTGLEPKARAEMLDAAMGVLETPAFAGVFAQGGRAEAPVIGGAPELPADTVINGRVDRLVVTDTDILIVDFKTDQPAPARAEDVAETYLAQMGAYYAVLKQAYPAHDISAALVWTDGPDLMQLPPERMLAALKSSREGLT